MDFSTPAVPPIEFTDNGDTFYAVGECPGGTVTDLALLADSDDTEGEALKNIMTFFDQVLLPESAELFADRLRDPEHPIGLPKAMKIFKWLVEQYTDFPTEEQPPSAPGSKRTAKSSAGRVSGSRATTRSQKTPEPAPSVAV